MVRLQYPRELACKETLQNMLGEAGVYGRHRIVRFRT
jgi:hypothetical protein